MITNERQFRISKTQLEKLRGAAEEFNFDEAVKRCGSPILAQAERDALKSQIEELVEEVQEYEALRSGAVGVLRAHSLAELPQILIKARIAQGLSQRDLAGRIGLKEQQIQRYESEDYATANLQRLGEIAEALNLNISEVAEFNQQLQAKQQDSSEAMAWNRFPIREMYQRNWFENYTGSLANAMAQAEVLVGDLVARAGRQPQMALHRKRVRSGSTIDFYSLFAWQCRILDLANAAKPPQEYQPDRLDDAWFKLLAQQSSLPDGPLRAKRQIEEAGIPLVIEPHLPSTHLDGAALLGDRGPVIGLTLRFDRLDNFWFVLFHELMHVKLHLQKGRVEEIFDDLEAEADGLEREADEQAGRALIPDDLWDTALARYVRTADSIRTFAEENHISEAIVAGRIRKEADNYIMFKELVGFGQVRRLFPEVQFGQ